MQLDKETGKIVVAPDEATSVPNIYAIGDISQVDTKPQHHRHPAYRDPFKHSVILFLFFRSPTHCLESVVRLSVFKEQLG